ncbi:MAG: EAL domain-containing protein [Acutalibacter sp.]|jgi:EAL domain-containing protein (putative c-di-GMP-specific phosphodiesterase class I)/GGDEF domain-containing protein
MVEERGTVYVAGNPDAYPVEYYDKDTGTYQGILPDLLEKFSQESGIQVVYYQPGEVDRREHLAKNQQVDLVSGYGEGDALPRRTGEVTAFVVQQDGEEAAWSLGVTPAAPETLEEELEAFFAGVSQEEITGSLLETATAPKPSAALLWTAGGLALALVLVVVALAMVVRRYRKKLTRAQQDLEADPVTGLGNGEYLKRYFRQYVNDKNRILYSVVYFYVDTDRLRRLSSSGETEEFLRYCGAVLEEYTGDTDLLAKVGDRGFAILKLLGGSDELHHWIHPIFDRVREYTRLFSKPYEVGITAGVYPLKEADNNLDEMLVSASETARLAQRDGQDYMVCSQGILERIARESQLQAGLEQAFLRKEFQLYLQFYVDAVSKQVVGGEALSRWNHPQRGTLSPGVFVPLMEREKMISRLDYYCLEEVCAFLEDLYKHGVETFFISCNFSRETFAAGDFVQRCREIVERYRFPRELLILELTESASVKNMDQIKTNMMALEESGVSVALDDFGEGFTSFYDLQKYPVNGLKLDKGLVDCATTPSGRAILRAMIQVGHELGMTILAEGVENDGQAQVLEELNCDVIQGFHYCVPLPDWEARRRILELFPA